MTRAAVVLVTAVVVMALGGAPGGASAAAAPTEPPTAPPTPTTPPASVTQVPGPSEDPAHDANPEDAADAADADEGVTEVEEDVTVSGDGEGSPPASANPVAPTSPDGEPSDRPDPAAVRRVLAEIADATEASPPDLTRSLFGEPAGPPWGNYELGASVGFADGLLSQWARIEFEIGKLGVLFAGWVSDVVLRFDLGRWIAGDVGTLSGRYARLLDSGGLPLRELVLLLAVAHAGWQILRHRGHAAVPELLVATVIAATGGYLLATADTAACRGLSVMAELTAGTLALADVEQVDGDPADDGPTGQTQPARDWCAEEPVTAAAGSATPRVIAQTFVHEPFLLLQWGAVPADGGCRTVADAIIASRPWGDDDRPREWMAAAGCHGMVTFNEDMTSARAAGAAAYAVAALAFAIAVVMTAGTLLVAQVAGALLVLAMPFAVVIGIAPGAGRDLLARWVHGVLKVTVLFMGSGFFLAFLISSVSAVQSGTDGRGVLVRMLASTAVAWSLVILRGRVMGHMRLVAHGAARSASGGRDVGGVGTGPAQAAVNRTFQAADLAATVHAGAAAGIAVARGTAGGSMRAAGVSRGLAIRHRARGTRGPQQGPAPGPAPPRRRPLPPPAPSGPTGPSPAPPGGGSAGTGGGGSP